MRAASIFCLVTLLSACGRTEPLEDEPVAVDYSGFLLLAYAVAQAERPTRVHVAAVSPNGARSEALALDAADFERGFHWSDRGRWLVSAHNHASGSRLTAWSPNGGTHRVALADRIHALHWAKTEDALAIWTRRGSEAELSVADLRGSTIARTTVDVIRAPAALCAFSEDGVHAAYHGAELPLRVAQLDRSRAGMPTLGTVTTHANGQECSASADGRWVAANFGSSVIAVADAEEKVTVPTGLCFPDPDGLSWAPDHSVLGFHSERWRSEECDPCELCIGDPKPTFDLGVVDFREEAPSAIIIALGGAFPARAVAWATTRAGASRLAFAAPGPDDAPLLKISDIRGGVVDVATLRLSSDQLDAFLSPDGEAIAYPVFDAKTSGLLVAFADDWQPRPVAAASTRTCAWSPNAAHLLCELRFERDAEDTSELWSFSFASVPERAVRVATTADGSTFSSWSMSRGSEMLAYVETQSDKVARIVLVPFDQSGPRLHEQSSIQPAGEVTRIAWQP